MTEPKHRLSSNAFVTETDEQPTSAGFPKIRNDFSKPLSAPEPDISKEVEDFSKLNKDMISADQIPAIESKKKGRLLSPILAAISNFNFAKKLHKENLEHNPLPDTITDRMYKKIQMQRQEEDKHFATGKLHMNSSNLLAII